MYAIIEDGGKQYKVAPGDTVCVEQHDLAEGENEIEFDRVLFYRDEENTFIGQPLVKNAKVRARVIDAQAKGPKLYPMQYRRRKNSRRRIGHRQKYLAVEITEITST